MFRFSYHSMPHTSLTFNGKIQVHKHTHTHTHTHTHKWEKMRMWSQRWLQYHTWLNSLLPKIFVNKPLVASYSGRPVYLFHFSAVTLPIKLVQMHPAHPWWPSSSVSLTAKWPSPTMEMPRRIYWMMSAKVAAEFHPSILHKVCHLLPRLLPFTLQRVLRTQTLTIT